jgi:hypothetical protein
MHRFVLIVLMALLCACAPTADRGGRPGGELTWEASAQDFGRVALVLVKSLDARYTSAYINRISDSASIETYQIIGINLERNGLEIIYIVKSDRIVDLYVSDRTEPDEEKWRPITVNLERALVTALDANFKRANSQ